MVDDGGMTPIQWAARYGHGDVVRLLMELGADIHKANNYGFSPCDLCGE